MVLVPNLDLITSFEGGIPPYIPTLTTEDQARYRQLFIVPPPKRSRVISADWNNSELPTCQVIPNWSAVEASDLWVYICVYSWGGAEIACDRQRQYLCLFLARIGSDQMGMGMAMGMGMIMRSLLVPLNWRRFRFEVEQVAAQFALCLCIILWAWLIVLCP